MMAPRTRRKTRSAKGCKRLREFKNTLSSQFSVLSSQFSVLSSQKLDVGDQSKDGKKYNSALLPGRIGAAVAGGQVGAAVDINDSGLRLVRGHDGVFLLDLPGIVAPGHGIFGNEFQIVGRDQIIESLRRLLFVESVLLNHVAQREQVLAERRLLGPE